MKRLPPMLLWGFAPLVFAGVLVVLVMLFAPSIAPEHYVPDVTATTSTTTAPSSTTSTTEAGG